MKNLLVTLFFTVATLGWSIAQDHITLTQTFDVTEDCNFAFFALKGQTNVIVWDEPTIKIITRIHAPEVTLKTLDEIITKGRYQVDLNFYEEERAMLFQMPQVEKIIHINGFDFKEILEFEVYIPKQVRYRLTNPLKPAFL